MKLDRRGNVLDFILFKLTLLLWFDRDLVLGFDHLYLNKAFNVRIWMTTAYDS